MLAVHIHARRNVTISSGTPVLPILTWETARPQIKLWMKAIRTGQFGPDRKLGDFMTLLQIPEEHRVILIVGGSSFNRKELSYYRCSDMPSEDREILNNWLKNSPELPTTLSKDAFAYVPELVLGDPLDRSNIKWTKDIRLLYGKERPRSER